MLPQETGKKYDQIAHWWHAQLRDSQYGVAQLERAIRYCANHRAALDVGCGSGGRMIQKLLEAGFQVSGVDVSATMIELARHHHPAVTFYQADISEWNSSEKFDLIIAWDSLFHLPLSLHAPVLTKLCKLLRPGGILLYTFGDACGEHESDWCGDRFFYGSIGIDQNLKVLAENGCQCRHLELDQFPLPHVYLIAQRVG